MRPFTAYLRDLNKIYEFKIKIAGELKTDTNKQIEAALDQYKPQSCSAGKRLPIAERHQDFPELSNHEITIFDVKTAYPATSQMVRAVIAEKLKVPLEFVRVRNLNEQEEAVINHQHDEPTGKSRLNTPDLEFVPGGQDMVGQKHTMALLKELNKQKHDGEQYTGVNDAILAKGQPKHTPETLTKTTAKNNIDSVISTKGPKLQPVRSGQKI